MKVTTVQRNRKLYRVTYRRVGRTRHTRYFGTKPAAQKFITNLRAGREDLSKLSELELEITAYVAWNPLDIDAFLANTPQRQARSHSAEPDDDVIDLAGLDLED